MSLVAYGNGSEATIESIENNGFWPDIDPNDFRDRHHLGGTVTTPRLETALRVAMASVNRQLSVWQANRVDDGYPAADAVPLEPWQVAGHNTLLYVRAVYAEAHANLLERYRDVSATRDGDERGEAALSAADEYRRDARWAVAEIQGRTHTTVELI